SMRRVFEHDMAVYLLVLLVVWVAYALLVTFAPANLNLSRYGITIAQGHVLQITVLLPQLLIWVTALYAYLRFNGYARLVGNSPEASGFKHMEWGLLMLFLVLVIPAWVGLYASYSPESDLVQKVVVILRNYTSLFLYALA